MRQLLCPRRSCCVHRAVPACPPRSGHRPVACSRRQRRSISDACACVAASKHPGCWLPAGFAQNARHRGQRRQGLEWWYDCPRCAPLRVASAGRGRPRASTKRSMKEDSHPPLRYCSEQVPGHRVSREERFPLRGHAPEEAQMGLRALGEASGPMMVLPRRCLCWSPRQLGLSFF